jgi:hypothetical protein
MRLPRWRKATWALVSWCALILAWTIGGGASADCGSESTDLNQSACEAGTGIGIVIILILGFFGFVFLSFIWLMSRPKHRACPRCGSDVKKGVMACGACGYDFNAMGQSGQGPMPPPPPSPPPPPIPVASGQG